MAKFDLKSAYRHIPVHPDDRTLLGMQWKDQLFVATFWPTLRPNDIQCSSGGIGIRHPTEGRGSVGPLSGRLHNCG